MTTSTAGLPVTGEEVHRFGKELENLRKDCSRSSAVCGGGMSGGGLESVLLGARPWDKWKRMPKALRLEKQTIQV